jgi:hypothetical protein
MKELHMRRIIRRAGVLAVLATALSLGGCSGSVGVGLNVGVPIGNHGYINVGTGTSRWY